LPNKSTKKGKIKDSLGLIQLDVRFCAVTPFTGLHRFKSFSNVT